eukprot:m51a1_g7631 hypothetical protein (305) ;mRNA; f:323569-324926
MATFTNPWDTWTGGTSRCCALLHTLWNLPSLFSGLLWPAASPSAAFSADLEASIPWERTDPSELAAAPSGGLQAVWAGQSSVVVQAAGMTVLVDPVWAASLWPSIARLRPVPFELRDLPRVDVVLVSHNHYDHLDYATVAALRDLFDPLFLVPAGLARWFRDSLVCRVEELDWWEQRESHWGGWVINDKQGGHTVYHAGDTGMCPAFREIGSRYGPFDLSFIPIGPVEPREVMEEQHLDPVDAIEVHREVMSKRSVAIHIGTFSFGISSELPGDPVRGLERWTREFGIPRGTFTVEPIGRVIRV